MSQCLQFRGFRFSFGNISQLGHNKTFFYCYIINMELIYDICHVSKIRHKDFRLFVHPLSVTLRLPPLDSETGWTGELWSNFWIWGFFMNFCIFFGFSDFFCLDFLLPKVTKVSTDHRKLPKKNGPKQHNKLFFVRTTVSSKGQSPPQELEVGPHSGRIF